MKAQKPVKICLATSAGGHLTQLLRLADSWQQYEAIYVSTSNVVTKKLRQYGQTYIVGECNRQHPFRVIQVFCRCAKIVFRERPDVVISTGAAPGFLFCLTAKIFGAKIIWIDSIANVERLSLSGWLVRPIADLFLTQWQELANRYNKVEYVGSII